MNLAAFEREDLELLDDRKNIKDGPAGIRTQDRWLRRPALYPS
jgi:hypothetical protein